MRPAAAAKHNQRIESLDHLAEFRADVQSFFLEWRPQRL
jgi:hypothetical protein